MKNLILFISLVVGVFGTNHPSIEPIEINEETFLDSSDLDESFANYSRMVYTNAKKGENLDLCYLYVKFAQKTQTCGCVVVDANWVLTSGRCVYE
jgi:hypothetical protein